MNFRNSPWPKPAGQKAKLATIEQPVPISPGAKEDAETKTAEVSSTKASSEGASVDKARLITSTRKENDGHEPGGKNNSEPSVSSPPRINRHAPGSYEGQNKPTPGEQQPPPRTAAEVSPSPKHMSVRGRKSKEGSITMDQSRARDTQHPPTNAAGDAADAGGAGNLQLENRPRVRSMSVVETSSERVSPRITA